MKKVVLFFVLSLSAAPIFSQSDNGHWYEKIFVQGSYSPYFVPGELKSYAKNDGGFRGSAGYDLQFEKLPKSLTIPLNLESGYSHIVGTNPLIQDIKSVPVTVFGGISWSPVDFISLYASFGVGTLISTVEHYQTALDVATNNLSVDTGLDLLLGARVGLGFNILNKSMTFYCDGGLDFVLESDGPIPLPMLNA